MSGLKLFQEIIIKYQLQCISKLKLIFENHTNSNNKIIMSKISIPIKKIHF